MTVVVSAVYLVPQLQTATLMSYNETCLSHSCSNESGIYDTETGGGGVWKSKSSIINNNIKAKYRQGEL